MSRIESPKNGFPQPAEFSVLLATSPALLVPLKSFVPSSASCLTGSSVLGSDVYQEDVVDCSFDTS